MLATYYVNLVLEVSSASNPERALSEYFNALLREKRYQTLKGEDGTEFIIRNGKANSQLEEGSIILVTHRRFTVYAGDEDARFGFIQIEGQANSVEWYATSSGVRFKGGPVPLLAKYELLAALTRLRIEKEGRGI